MDLIDYGQSGLSIQYAMLDQAKRFPNKSERPSFLLWNRIKVWTADRIGVPTAGRVKATFLDVRPEIEQGFDLKVSGGIELLDRSEVELLRTWFASDLPRSVKYPYTSPDGLLWVWNVYKMRYGGGAVVEEKWTGNAGFWVEEVSERERVYHCSAGSRPDPDFCDLVFKVEVTD